MNLKRRIKSEYMLEQKDLTIKDLKKQIRDLQDKLENVAIKVGSTATNNTHINNYIQKLELTTDEYMDQNVSNLTIEHIKGDLRDMLSMRWSIR